MRPIPELPDLAARLTWARGVSGLRASALSRKAGLSASHVWLIEKGQRTNIDVATAQSLAAALGVPLLWLLLGEGRLPSQSQIRCAADALKAS